MTDDDNKAGGSPEALLYDYFKHLTSLCLFALGGILALAEKSRGDRALVVGVLAMIALAGIAAFSGASEIVQNRFRAKPSMRGVHLYRIAAPALLSLGIGGFLYVYAKGLLAG